MSATTAPSIHTPADYEVTVAAMTSDEVGADTQALKARWIVAAATTQPFIRDHTAAWDAILDAATAFGREPGDVDPDPLSGGFGAPLTVNGITVAYARAVAA